MTCKAILSIFHMFPSVNTASGSRVLSTLSSRRWSSLGNLRYDTASGSRVLSTLKNFVASNMKTSYDTASGSRVLSTTKENCIMKKSVSVTIPQAVVGYCRRVDGSIAYEVETDGYDTASGSRVLSTAVHV